MNFKYPISKADNTDYQATDLYGILSRETSGHYLLGNHRFWHGGIHFSSETVQQCVLEQPIRCIADGEVIAYRITKKYQESTLHTTTLQYSNCFCLVKHEYKSPSEPEKTPEKEPIKLNDEWQGKSIRILAPTFPSYSNEDLNTDKKMMPKDLLLEVLEVKDTKKTVNSKEYYPIKAKVLKTVEAAGAKTNEASDAFPKDDEIWFAGFESDFNIRQSKDYKIALFEEEGKLNNQWQGKNIRILPPTFSSYSDHDLKKDKKTMPCGLMLEVLQVTNTKITLSKIVYYVIKCKVLQAVAAKATSGAYAKNEEIWFAGLKTDGSIRQSTAKVDLFKELVAQEWTDKTITLAKDYTGYKAIADSGNQASEKILVPEKTALQIKEVQTEIVNGYHYSKVTASTVLKIQGADKKTTELPANTEFWIALTDTEGYVPLTEDNKELYSDTTPPPEPKTNKLTFYSLYMHLLPYEEYPSKKEEIKRQAKVTANVLNARDKIIEDKTAQILGTLSKGTLLNILEAREDEASKNYCAKVTLANEDSKIILTDTTTKKTTEVTPPADGFWIVLKDKQADGKWRVLAEELEQPKREYPSYWAQQVTANVITVMDALQAPTKDVAGATLGVQLAIKDEVTYSNQTIKEVTLDKTTYLMAKCKLTKEKAEFTKKNITSFWAIIDSKHMTTTQAIPISFDDVEKNHKIKISAGDPVGYIGLHEVPLSATGGKSDKPKKQVHIEVFTLEEEAELKKFLDNEAGLTGGKQHIQIPKGTVLDKQQEPIPEATLNSIWQNKETQTLAKGFASYTSETLSATGKKRMPKGLKLKILEVKDTTTKIGNTNYYVAKASVLEDIKEDDKKTTSAYAKDEEMWFAAFTADKKINYSTSQQTNLFEDTTPKPEETPKTDTEKLQEIYYQTKYDHIIPPERAKLVNNKCLVTIYEDKQSITGTIPTPKKTISQYALTTLGFNIVKEENTDKDGYVSQNTTDGFVDQKNMTPFYQEICIEMDRKENGGDGDGNLSLSELERALTDPALSDKWSKLVAYHPTEWQASADDPKWQRLASEVLPGEANKALREHEKQRINKLVFWDAVPDLEGKKAAFHFHPVAFVESLQNNISSTFDKKYTAKDNEVYINVITPKTRDLEGPLVVFDSSGILFKTHSLCRGSSSNRTKASENGDTPTGRATTSYAPKAHNGSYSFGNHGLIYLIGESGEFLTATKNGRAGIAIHCGHTTGYYNKSLEDLDKLMGTHGCVRIYNNAMKELGELYTKLKNDGKTIYCYIEDYDGDIKKVYVHYGFAEDPKDSTRGARSTLQ